MIKALIRYAIAPLLLLAVAVAGSACLSPAATTWNGIQANRSEAGVNTLEWDGQLYEYAQLRVNDMAATGIFNHDAMWKFARLYRDSTAYRGGMAENIAWITPASAAGPDHPNKIVEMWWASPPHWAIAMSGQYHRAAIATAIDQQRDILYVVMWFTY